jgi:hypothetical protein
MIKIYNDNGVEVESHGIGSFRIYPHGDSWDILEQVTIETDPFDDRLDTKIKFVDSNNKVVMYHFEHWCCEQVSVTLPNDFKDKNFTGDYITDIHESFDGYRYGSVKFFLTGGGELTIAKENTCSDYEHNFSFDNMSFEEKPAKQLNFIVRGYL